MQTHSEKGNVQQTRSMDITQINPSIHAPAPDDSFAGYFTELLLPIRSLSILLALGLGISNKV